MSTPVCTVLKAPDAQEAEERLLWIYLGGALSCAAVWCRRPVCRHRASRDLASKSCPKKGYIGAFTIFGVPYEGDPLLGVLYLREPQNSVLAELFSPPELLVLLDMFFLSSSGWDLGWEPGSSKVKCLGAGDNCKVPFAEL